jgi:spore coat protein U-like protein
VPIPVENVTNPSTPTTATVPIAITLPSNTPGKITLGQGQNPSNVSTDTNPVRRMTDGAGNFLLYELYQDESKTIIWGNTDNNVYIKIPAGQNVPAGNYQDVVQLRATL